MAGLSNVHETLTVSVETESMPTLVGAAARAIGEKTPINANANVQI